MNAPDGITLGLVPDMPAQQYHAIHAMSAGGLRLMQQSPAHFFGLQLDPRRPSGGTTPAMAAGALFHVSLFEPSELAIRYVTKPHGHDGRTKEGKAWAAEHAGLKIIDAVSLATAQAQAAAVRALPEIAALMSDGMGEASAFWIDGHTGELCKCRPDWTSPAGDGVILVDGKSCQDASPDGFARSIWTYDYHLQAAWYSDGFEAATGKRVHGFVFAAVESAWPHAAAAYMLGDDVLDKARAINRRLLDAYAACKRTGAWPGYPTTIQHINLPRWADLENA
jgi:exodeoxyribonuclease VIII